MYRFQVRQRRKLASSDAENASVKDPNGNINAIEALVLASEGKGQMNGIIANVIHESLEHADPPTNTSNAVTSRPHEPRGVENQGFVQEEVKVKDC